MTTICDYVNSSIRTAIGRTRNYFAPNHAGIGGAIFRVADMYGPAFVAAAGLSLGFYIAPTSPLIGIPIAALSGGALMGALTALPARLALILHLPAEYPELADRDLCLFKERTRGG